jgi:hypothetical protein
MKESGEKAGTEDPAAMVKFPDPVVSSYQMGGSADELDQEPGYAA